MRSHQKEFSIEKMAEIFNVSRSGFYRPRGRQEKPYDEDIDKIFKEHKV